MVTNKALYGLRTSGARFHNRLSDVLRELGFEPCKNDGDLWLRDAGDCYEYICVYVDDLMAIMKDAKGFFHILETKYHFKLKGVGVPDYHLGGNFGRDTDGTLFWGAKTYIQKMMENYKRMFNGTLPKKCSSPMDKDDSPELDESPNLGPKGVRIYMSMIGALQWAVTLGRFDIAVAVMSMSRFRMEPHEGHLVRVQRIYRYLRANPDAAIKIQDWNSTK